MNSTISHNSTSSPLGLAPDTHGSLYKVIGVTLAIASGNMTKHKNNNILIIYIGMFIGSSFVFKKKGLLQSTEKTGND